MRFIFILLLSFQCLAQNSAVNLAITKLESKDTLEHFTKYNVEYELKNVSNHEVQFYNSTDNPMQLNYRNTSSIYAVFGIYDDNVKLNKDLFYINNYFLEVNRFTVLSEEKGELEQKSYQDSIKKHLKRRMPFDTINLQKRIDSMTKIRIKRLSSFNDFDYVKNALITLKPNESIKGKLFFYWYKKKYRKIDNEEFFIDEKPKQLEIVLLINDRKELKRYFDPEEYKKIEANPNFIDGLFYSDKVSIIFKE